MNNQQPTLSMTMPEMYALNCATCYIAFWMPKIFNDDMRRNHRRFYCPKGHVNFYPKPKVEKKKSVRKIK